MMGVPVASWMACEQANLVSVVSKSGTDSLPCTAIGEKHCPILNRHIGHSDQAHCLLHYIKQ